MIATLLSPVHVNEISILASVWASAFAALIAVSFRKALQSKVFAANRFLGYLGRFLRRNLYGMSLK